jgi:hypothetical protein
MEKKQTAIDWLFLMLNDPNRNQDFAKKLYDKAKEIEKEQIRDAWTDGCIGELYELNAYFSSGKYYNATYGIC